MERVMGVVAEHLEQDGSREDVVDERPTHRHAELHADTDRHVTSTASDSHRLRMRILRVLNFRRICI